MNIWRTDYKAVVFNFARIPVAHVAHTYPTAYSTDLCTLSLLYMYMMIIPVVPFFACLVYEIIGRSHLIIPDCSYHRPALPDKTSDPWSMDF